MSADFPFFQPQQSHPRTGNDAPDVPEPFLLTAEDLFSSPPAPAPTPEESRVPLQAVTADESEGGAPKVWATVNVDRLLAFSERFQPELLAPAALKSWFAALASQAMLACYKERGARPAILALGFAAGNRADPFFDLPGEPIPVSLAPTAGTGTATAPHMRLRFESDRDIWIRSRRELILMAPASPTESLRACRLFVEFGSLDAAGHMTYTFRPASYEVITPDQAMSHPPAPIRRAA